MDKNRMRIGMYIGIGLIIYLSVAALIFQNLSLSDSQVIRQGLFYPQKTPILASVSIIFIWPPLIIGFILTIVGFFLPVSFYGGKLLKKYISIIFFILIFISGFFVRYEAQFYLDKLQDRQSNKVKEFYGRVTEGDYASLAIKKSDQFSILYKIKKLDDYKLRLEYDLGESDLTTLEFFLPYSDNSLIVTLSAPVTEANSKILKRYCYNSYFRNPPQEFISVPMWNGRMGITINPEWRKMSDHTFTCP